MSIDFGPIVAGPYTGAYNSVDVGFTLEGFRFSQDYAGEMINQSDLFGETIIDIIYRGGNAQMSYTSRTYKAGSISPFWPWGNLGQILTTAKPIARNARSEAKAMVLTSTPNTPAAASPASVTATLAILAPNSRGELLFDSKSRYVPVVLQLLPYESAAGTLTTITTT